MPQFLVWKYLKDTLVWKYLKDTLKKDIKKIVLLYSQGDHEEESKIPAERLKEFFNRIYENKDFTELREINHNNKSALDQDFQKIIEDYCQNQAQAIINITNGNKLMTLSAFQQAKNKVDACYLERGNQFIHYQHKSDDFTSEPLDPKICDDIDPLDIIRCHLVDGNLIINSDFEKIKPLEKLINKNINELIGEYRYAKRIINNPKATSVKISNEIVKVFNEYIDKFKPPAILNIGDGLEYFTSLCLLKCGVKVIYKGLKLQMPRVIEGGWETDQEQDLIFIHNGKLWLVDCKNEVDHFNILKKAINDQYVNYSFNNANSKFNNVFTKINKALKNRERSLIRLDLFYAQNFGGLTAEVICVRNPEIVENNDFLQYANQLNLIKIVKNDDNLFNNLKKLLKN